MHPQCPIFDEKSEGLIFSAVKMPIMKLGLIACLNRPTQLYHIAKPIVEKKKWTEFDSKDSYLKQINPEYKSSWVSIRKTLLKLARRTAR